ncbi:ArsC/Spx/MgsR family protein [Desulfitobacterium sp. Sab5]|uniref:ArsC/Spx/MgsR family protein n=1 Tax=Desulfitobacterium nosdiversum TaxID=3375356 RepID=UPI003CE7FFDD
MAHIIFYTKPGCIGGAKQKDFLLKAGHTVDERSIFETKWTPDLLMSFFKDLELEKWFNKNAPDVKAGTVILGALPQKETLDLLCRNPILITRPLMVIEGRYIAGFDPEALSNIIKLQELPNDDLTECQMNSAINPCNAV